MGGSVLQIDQVRINNLHAAELWGLVSLAEACEHKLEPVFPIFMLRLEGKPVAFYYATPHVCIRPTVHPDVMSAREFYEVAKVAIQTTRMFGNPLWLVHDKSVLASPKLLRKVGLVEQDLKVFEVT
jgi:hypothetical protein